MFSFKAKNNLKETNNVKKEDNFEMLNYPCESYGNLFVSLTVMTHLYKAHILLGLIHPDSEGLSVSLTHHRLSAKSTCTFAF